MELLFELLLTAAATLLVACLLAKLFSSDPRHDRAPVGPAGVIAVEQEEEEERIIEVDEVRAKGAPEPALSEGWVEVEKAPAAAAVAVAAEGKAAWVAVEEDVPAALAPELFLGTVLEERKEEGEVGKTTRGLTDATEVAAEAKSRDLGDVAAAPREILDLEMEKATVRQHDLAAQAAPTQVLDAGLQKQEVQPTEAAQVKQSALDAPAEVIDAVLEEEEEEVEEQAVQVIPHELPSESAPDAVLDAVLEKQQEEEQVTEVDQHDLAADVAPRVTPDMVARELASEMAPRAIPDAVARELTSEGAPIAIPVVVATEEPKEQSVEQVVDQHEQVQNKEEPQCQLGPVDQQEQLVPEEELVVPKADDLNVSQEGRSNDKAAVQLPEKEATTLLEMPEDEASANMEFEEWEGIERSEVEKRFGAAAAFAASEGGAAALSKLDSDVQMQLQGLLKVAVDGPCYDSAQPLTLRPSSRAKWVSWQKLGNMHPEIAMGKYMDLLSEFIPRWMGDKTSSTKKHEGDADSDGAALTMAACTSNPQTNQGNEGSTSIDEGPLTSPPNPEKGQSCDTPPAE